MIGIQYLNGQWVKAEDLKISAYDLNVTRGIGVFESLRTYNKQPFAVKEHLDRLRKSLATLDIPMDISDKSIRQIMEQGISKNDHDEYIIRIAITGGINEGRLSSSKPQLIVMFMPLKMPSEEEYLKGKYFITFEAERTLPQIKSVNYVQAKIGLMKADKVGANDAIYIDRHGNILESTISNLFFVKNDKLYTPSLDGILPGITRSKVIALAKENNIEVVETDIRPADLKAFDEAFACSSIKEIVPLVRIDEHEFADGKPGKMTLRLRNLFKTKYSL